jgi:large subunit ribosomal protein L21
MYAIVEIAGQQFKVEKSQDIFVHRLEAEAGKKVEFSEVLLIDDKGKISIGKPFIEGSKITARVLEHVRGDKVVVFKKTKRKGTQKESGHRQNFTKIHIETISLKGAAKEKKSAKKEEAPELSPETDSAGEAK